MATIMVVDDMPIFRDPIAASLELAGHKTLCAADGKEALTTLAQHRPDLILLDLAMPKMDGLTCLRALRQDRQTAKIPVILLTAAMDRKSILEAAKIGVQEYMLKSKFTVKDLLERISKQLASASAAASAASSIAVKTPAVATISANEMPASQANSSEIPELLSRQDSLNRARKAMPNRAISGVAAEVLASASLPMADIGILATMIAKDPMLSARVLQVANSAAYGSNRGRVVTVPDAARRIGCSSIRNIAGAFGVYDAMPAGADGFDAVRFWQHSFGVAMLCERFAPLIGVEPGVAYVVGLCHDLCDVLLRSCFAKEYEQILKLHRTHNKTIKELTRATLNVSHGELVTMVLRGLGLPDSISAPIEAFHAHRPQAEQKNKMAQALQLADLYANGLLLASDAESPLSPIAASECRQTLRVDAPPLPDATALCNEVYTLTAVLAKPSGSQANLLAPRFKPGGMRIWLARDAKLSALDPVAAALEKLSSLTVQPRLPDAAEILEIDKVVVAGASSGAFDPAAIAAMISPQPDKPVLQLVLDRPATAGGGVPRGCSIALSELAAFCGAT